MDSFLDYIISFEGVMTVSATDVASVAYLKFLLCNFQCAVLVANDQQCPFAAVKDQRDKCFVSEFPDRFYEDSVDEICQYVCILFPCCFNNLY